MASPQTLKIAFCICDQVTLSDFIPPAELLLTINDADTKLFCSDYGEVPYRLAPDYVAPSMDPVVPMTGFGPKIVPTQTYENAMKEGIQYDILWVPAGPWPPSHLPPSQIEFLKNQAPGAKYIISVCAGSVALGIAGILSGKKATTNKAFFKLIVSETPKDIQWVPKARWVVDGNIWTSSGVSAGSDMALAFMEHLVGPKVAKVAQNGAEVTANGQGDDPFAEIHGLV